MNTKTVTIVVLLFSILAAFAAGAGGLFATDGWSRTAIVFGAIAAGSGSVVLAFRQKLGAAVALLAVVFAVGACTPAQSATWSKIEQTVLADLENGVALTDIETAIVTIDPALAGDAQALDNIIQEAIGYLESVGAIPVAAQPNANVLKAAIRAKAVAK